MSKVLEINVDDQNLGGVYALVSNVIHRKIPEQKIDIAAIEPFEHPENVEDLASCGTEVYYVGYAGNKWKKQLVCYKKLVRLIRENAYDCVHVHSDVANKLLVAGLAARRAGVKKIILHSHAAGIDGGRRALKELFHGVSRVFLPYVGTCYAACSDLAAKWMFPGIPADRIVAVRNGVELERFRYDPAQRRKTRASLGIGGETLVGHVGRFAWQKNHDFLVDVMRRIRQEGVSAKLLLVGEGPEKERIQRLVAENDLQDSVIFYGISDRVDELMQAMDVFVLPSRFEGLPVVGVEAQAAGLPVLFSDQITRQAALTDSAMFIGIGERDVDDWVGGIRRCSSAERRDTYQRLKQQGFDILDTVEAFMKLYR